MSAPSRARAVCTLLPASLIVSIAKTGWSTDNAEMLANHDGDDTAMPCNNTIGVQLPVPDDTTWVVPKRVATSPSEGGVGHTARPRS